jgi:predicted SprT family Zn-dependent metalloprotease
VSLAEQYHDQTVRRLLHIALSLIALSAIVVGAAYAYDRETVHNADLPELYRQMNHDSFQGKLPYAQLRWTEIPHRYGQTTVYDDGTAFIEIDRNVVKTRRELILTLEHEGCHALTYRDARDEDDHGVTWRSCMTRFPKQD